MYISVRERALRYAAAVKEPAVEMSIADARAHMADVINAAAVRGRTTYLTSRGRRVAAVVPLSVAEGAEEADREGPASPTTT
jgi:prevent-host-death family protein